MKPGNSSGHTELLRNILRDERLRRKLSTATVAELISREPDVEPLTGESIRLYEKLERNPKIDTFAAWARVLGFRLIVDLDRVELKRANVLLRTAEAVEVAKLVDAMPSGRRRALLELLRNEDRGANADD